MSSNNTNVSVSVNAPVSKALLDAPYLLNIWFGLFLFVTGNFSCFGNLLVFTSRAFRSRACSIYLIFESFLNIIYFDYVLVTRIIQKGFAFPIINRYDVICKIRQFFSTYAHQVAFTLFALATMDRILSTQRSLGKCDVDRSSSHPRSFPAHRRWSNRVSLAYKLVPSIILTWFGLLGHRLFLYSNASGSCIPQRGFYEKYDIYFESVMSGICPPIILFILGLVLLRNVRQVVHRRVLPGNNNTANPQSAIPLTSIQQIDTQITKMLLLQSFVALPSFLPYGAQNLYSTITQDFYKSPLRLAWEAIVIEIIRLFSYFFYSTSFYVSFGSSRGFRRAFFHALHLRSCHKTIDPTRTISTMTNRKHH